MTGRTDLDQVRSRLRASPLALGCMLFGRWGNMNGRLCNRLVSSALDRGITTFDTAAAYGDGESERLLGAALRGRRDGALVVTKIGGPQAGRRFPWSATAITRAVEDSLHRLGTDRIDVLMIHRLDDDVPLDLLLETLDSLHRAGTFRALGSSSVAGDLLVELVHAGRSYPAIPVVVEQCPYSILNRWAEAAILPVTVRHSLTTMVFGVLEEGLLTRDRHVATTVGRPERRMDLQMWPDAARAGLIRRYRIVEELAGIAAAGGHTITSLALAFAAGHDAVAVTVVGARTEEQLDRACRAAAGTVPDDIRTQIDRLVPPGTAVGPPDLMHVRGVLRRQGA